MSEGFYTAQQVSRLAGVPEGTLKEWRSRKIISPTIEVSSAGHAAERGYSYADLVLVKMLRALREKKIEFRSAAVALRHLYQRLGPPSRRWADAKVYFVGKRIYAYKPDEWPVTDATEYGQTVAEEMFGSLFDELRAQEDNASLIVPREFWKFVEVSPEIMGGAPVVRGTRIPTAMIADLSDDGMSLRELAHLYSPLSRGYIAKAIEYEQFLDQRLTQTA